MARVVICDYLKTKLGKDDPTFTVTVGDQEFEVGQEGRDLLLRQLEGETAPVERDAPPPPLVAAPPGINVDSPDDPFETGPSSMPQPVMDEGSEDDPLVLEIPDDPRKRFKTPSESVAKRVIREATIFDEGTLPSLTMGAEAHRQAMRRLRDLEAREEKKIRLPDGVNMGNRDRP